MNFDLRIPIGLLFSFYGIVLVVYGLATQQSQIYDKSLAININLVWGAVMLIFGAFMLVMAMRGRKSK